MKKIAITLTIVIGLSMTVFANPNEGGLFQRGASESEVMTLYGVRSEGMPKLPIHAQQENQDAPIGSGIVVFVGLGVAYLVGKKRKEED